MPKRIIIAGGGTGGHIFPAVAVAQAIMRKCSVCEILFVGANGKMEMEKVPAAGFAIKGLDIAGFNRTKIWKNLSLPYKLLKSFLQTRNIINAFKPDAAFGVGGYSSYPVLRYAQQVGLPTFLHESNAFAGKSNMLLGKKATSVFTGTRGMEKFFPAEKILVTGNPIRRSIIENPYQRDEALAALGFAADRLLILVVGGSQGALSINKQIASLLPQMANSRIQLLWQTGNAFITTANAAAATFGKDIKPTAFIQDMALAYAAADIVVSRSGAMSVAELAVSGKASVFVPFPHAAEDHQTYNAKQLADAGAALLVKDADLPEALWPALQLLLTDANKRKVMQVNIKQFSITNADDVIADAILSVV